MNARTQMLTRHAALLERVTVLERALEKVDVVAQEGRVRRTTADEALSRIGELTREALEGE